MYSIYIGSYRVGYAANAAEAIARMNEIARRTQERARVVWERAQ